MAQNFTTSTEDKIAWLHAHPELWKGITINYVFNNREYMYLFAKMRAAGLYSEKTSAKDARLERLVEKALARS